VLYRGQQLALAEFLPLEAANWITCGNALRLGLAQHLPATGKGVKNRAEDLFETPLDQAEIDFANEGGETYICGNPPYLGSTWQSAEQKADIRRIFEAKTKTFGALDYVAGWFMKAADFGIHCKSAAAFVATNSICQGQQVPFFWPLIFNLGQTIVFAHTSFKWANLASHNAGVTVVIVGIARYPLAQRRLFSVADGGEVIAKEAANINAYLVSGADVIVKKAMNPLTEVSVMDFGNKADDGGHLTLTAEELGAMRLEHCERTKFIKAFYGSKEFINGETRFCIWVTDEGLKEALEVTPLKERISRVRDARLASKDAYARSLAARAHQFKTPRLAESHVIITPRVSSENRPYLPVGYLTSDAVIGDRNFALYDAPLWNMALIASRLHWVWIGTVCVRLEMRFSYSNTLGWNTFPVPPLTERTKPTSPVVRRTSFWRARRIFRRPLPTFTTRRCPTMPAHDLRIYIGRRMSGNDETTWSGSHLHRPPLQERHRAAGENNNRFSARAIFYEASCTRHAEMTGMFHEWDKQLRQWLVREIRNWHKGESFPRKIWSVDFVELMKILESMGWKIREADYFQSLDACRLVVNVHKHGEGISLDHLKEKYPEYLLDALGGLSVHLVGKDLREHTDLQVSDEQFQAFSDAIAAFWTAVPENTSESQIENLPDWAERAILRDMARNHQPSQG
jgi:hypothetical protein